MLDALGHDPVSLDALQARTGGVVSIPASVTVPAGAMQASFNVNALEVGNTLVAATLNGSTVEAAVQVTPVPAAVAALTLPFLLPYTELRALDGFDVSRAEAEAMIMQARVKAGWITEADLKKPDAPADAGASENQPV